MYVCHKHFEKRFIRAGSHLGAFAYPSLFTEEEILTGVPAASHLYQENECLAEHSYVAKLHIDHSYCKSHWQELKEAQELNYNNSNYVEKTIHKVNFSIADYLTQFDPLDSSTSQHLNLANSKKVVRTYINKKCGSALSSDPFNSYSSFQFLSEANRYIDPKEIIVLPSSSIKLSATSPALKPEEKFNILRQRRALNFEAKYKLLLKKYTKAIRQRDNAIKAKLALKYSRKESFFKLTAKLNPLARQFLWLQISQCKKKNTGRRFTDEDKLTAMTIMEKNPKCYEFLREIFILPSTKTINKELAAIKVDPVIISNQE